MRKLLFLLACVIVIVCANSCSDSDVVNEVSETSQSVYLKSDISYLEFQAVVAPIEKKFSLTRSDGSINFSEEDAKLLLEPFIIDGKNLQASFLEQMKPLENNLTEEESH